MTLVSWSTACPDWEERIVARQSLVPFAPLFPDEAEAALAVFKSLRIVDVVGQPTFGEACEDWVFDFVRAIFGAYDAKAGRRLIREFFLLISKKNGKSTIAAAIMLTALIRNWRHSAELLILAPTLEIANNSFYPARDMVLADPDLVDLLHVQENLRQIKHLTTGAVLKVVAADTDTVGGKKAAFVLIDELWIFGKRPNADAMLREATGGMASRLEGFVIYLSTHSDAPPAGVFKDKLHYFRAIRDGQMIDLKSFGVLYEFPKAFLDDDSYLDPANWYIPNPNIERSVSLEWLEDKLAEAQRGTGDGLRTHLAKHLNVEIGMNLRGDRWPGADHWEGAADHELSQLAHFDALEALLDRCEVIVVGIDGGGLDDLFGLTIVGREPAEIEVTVKVNGKMMPQRMKRWLCWSHAWCHRTVLTRRKSIASKLEDLEKAGELTIIDDALEDIASIIEIIKSIKDRELLAAVAVDPAGIGDFVDALADPEIDITQENDLLLGVPQGYALMNAIKTTERRLVSGMLKHCGGELMAWCVANVKIEPTATAIRATKQNAGDAKIDPWMALVDANTIMVRNPEAKVTASIYETQDLLIV
jgi:phage terminase large subunit-like protein